MKRLLTTGLIVSGLILAQILAAPAFAADKPTGYQSQAPLSLSAAAGETNTAKSDPLTDVTRVDLVVRLKCVDDGCATAAFGLSIEDEQDEAAALRIKSGLPGLLVKRISYDEKGQVVEYDLEYWRHDALRVSVDIRVTK